MQPFKHSFITIALLLLAVATYVVLAGGEPASPATTGEGTSESCLSQAHECVTATFLGYTHHTDGTTTLSYRITNNCAETVETVAIETGRWTRVAPTDGSRYTGNFGDYTTAWIGPVGDILTQGIRFTNASPDYHSGVSDEFTITVRDFVAESPNTIRVVTDGASLNHYSFRWMLLDPTCENGVEPLPSPTATATFTPTATLDPAIPTATWEYYPTPESCLRQDHECVTATFLGYSHHTDGTTTLTYRITNNCAETVETVAIETGHWTRVAPTDSGSYSGTLGDYTTAWTGPVGDILTQGIRFDNANPDYHSGMSDDFTITVRDFVPESPNTIRVVTNKSGINSYSFRWMLLDPTCENGVDPTPRPMPTSTPTATPTNTPTPVPTATQPFSPLPTPTPTPEAGVTLPTAPAVAACVFGPPAGGLPPEEAIIPLDAYSFSEPQLVLTNTAPIGIQQWLPDNETLLVTRHTGHGNQLELLNVQTRTVTQLLAPNRAIDAPRWLATDRSVFWRELGTPDNESGYWVRSFDPPSERHLSDNGTGAGVPYAVSPDGTQVLFLTLPGGTQPLLWNQATKTLRALPVDLAAWRYQNGPIYPFQPFNVVWQPGSEKILFWDGTWLFLYDLSTNSGCEIRTSTFVATPFTFVQAAAWSPNGRYLLLKNTEYPLYTMTSGPHDLVLVLDTYTGEAIQYALGNSVYSFSWAPDNQTIAVVKKTERQIQMADGGVAYRTGMFLFNIHNGLQQQILPIYSATSEDGLAWSPDGAWLAFLGSSLDTNGKRGSGGVQVSLVTKLP